MTTLAEPLHVDATTIDVDEFQFFQQARVDATRTTEFEVVIDFGAVRKINSECLNDLIRFRNDVKRGGRKLVLANVPNHLINLFLVTRMDRLMTIDSEHQSMRLTRRK